MTNDLAAFRPDGWDQYIGQQRLKDRLEVMIDAATKDERPLDHVLLTGPPGAGKTSLASLIAGRLNDDIMSVILTRQNIKQFYAMIEEFGVGVVLLDELHNTPPNIQEILQVALLEGELATPWHYTIDLSGITFIGATTSEHRAKLLEPLVQRFPVHLTWEPYTDEEMTTIITNMAERMDVDIPHDVAAGLGRAAGGTPRFVERLVKRARDLQTTGSEVSIEGVLSLVGLDTDGLADEQLEYLNVLRDIGGVAGRVNLASIMRMHPSTLEDLEVLLVRRGFIRRTVRGREITPAGRRKLGKPNRSVA